jgi:hypothetical protein
MKRLLVGSLAALTIGLGVAPVATADHCPSSDPACHEFDGFDPYLSAFQNHGIGYLASIPFLNDAMGICTGRETEASIWAFWQDAHGTSLPTLTRSEARKIAEAAKDVCPRGPS